MWQRFNRLSNLPVSKVNMFLTAPDVDLLGLRLDTVTIRGCDKNLLFYNMKFPASRNSRFSPRMLGHELSSLLNPYPLRCNAGLFQPCGQSALGTLWLPQRVQTWTAEAITPFQQDRTTHYTPRNHKSK